MKKTFCAALALLLTLCLSMCLLPSAWAEGESFSLGDEETFDASRGVIVNAENFPDSIFRAYVAENYDKEGDLVLTAEEYEAVTEMDVHGLGITSLDGVWFFPNLTVLNCSDNNLRELNVNDNPKLETLYCQGNFVWSETVGEGENAHTAYHGLEHLIPNSEPMVPPMSTATVLMIVPSIAQNPLQTLIFNEYSIVKGLFQQAS